MQSVGEDAAVMSSVEGDDVPTNGGGYSSNKFEECVRNEGFNVNEQFLKHQNKTVWLKG